MIDQPDGGHYQHHDVPSYDQRGVGHEQNCERRFGPFRKRMHHAKAGNKYRKGKDTRSSDGEIANIPFDH